MAEVDDKFWDDQVRHPAAAWVAAGARGVPMTPEERMATTHSPGGVAQITPMLESPIKQTSEGRKRKREDRKMRRQSAAQELAHFRDAAKSRQTSGSGGGGGGFGGDQGRESGKAGGKGAGKMKTHDESGKELCFSWTNRVGDCGNLPPRCPAPKAGYTSARSACPRNTGRRPAREGRRSSLRQGRPGWRRPCNTCS